MRGYSKLNNLFMASPLSRNTEFPGTPTRLIRGESGVKYIQCRAMEFLVLWIAPLKAFPGCGEKSKPHATTPQQKSQPAAGIHCAHFSNLLHAHAVGTKSADASRACRWHLVSNPKAFSGTLARHFERMFRAMPKSCNYQCDCTLLPQKLRFV